MGWKNDLKEWMRIVPGVAGHQDREAIRERDRVVRLSLVSELQGCGRGLEKIKPALDALIEKKELGLLQGIDYLSVKIDKLGNLIRYAGQNDRGRFDPWSIDPLEQLLAFDEDLFVEVESIKEQVHALEAAIDDPERLNREMHQVDRALDQLEKTFSIRCGLFMQR